MTPKTPREIFDSGNYERAFPECLRLAKAGDSDHQLLLGWMYLTGSGVEQDHREAVQWLKRASAGGDAMSGYYLGSAYELVGEFEQAATAYKDGVSAGYPPACYRMAQLHVAGRGVPRNVGRAYKLYEKAASGGNLFGKAKVASFLIRGRSGILGRLRGFATIPVIIAIVATQLLFQPSSEQLLH